MAGRTYWHRPSWWGWKIGRDGIEHALLAVVYVLIAYYWADDLLALLDTPLKQAIGLVMVGFGFREARDWEIEQLPKIWSLARRVPLVGHRLPETAPLRPATGFSAEVVAHGIAGVSHVWIIGALLILIL